MSLLAVGMLGVSGVAQAQTVSFTTVGLFQSNTATIVCDNTNPLDVFCTSTANTLRIDYFSHTETFDQPPVGVDLGGFTVTGTGDATLGATALSFTLAINQFAPPPGTTSGGDVGPVTGTVNVSPTSHGGNFFFTPSSQDIFVTNNGIESDYRIVLDQNGAIEIPAQGSVRITANLTASPEPGTIALFATGLAGLIPVVIRRRKNVSAE